MNLYNVSLLCFGFCSFLLGLLVWLKRVDVIGKRYFIMACFYSGWALSIAVNFNSEVSANLGLLMGRLGNAFAVFIPVSWYHFVVTYVGTFQKHRTRVKLLYLASFFIFCFAFSPWFIPRVIPMVGLKYYSQAGPLYYFFTIMFFTVVPMSFFEIYKKMKSGIANERQPLRGLFFTSLVGYLGGSPTFLPLFGISFPQYSLFLLPIYPFALAYFMIKRGLFDVEQLAQAAHRDKLMAIGVLAASINHEVRNPLFVIKGLAENCLERQKEGVFPNDRKALESANDAFAKTMQQADRAMDIIKRLSLFAKTGIESEIKFEPVKIAQVVEDILPLVRYELAAHNISLNREFPPDLPEVRADRRYLEEILFNLIVNAIQALKPNSPSKDLKVNWASHGNPQSEENSPNTIQFPQGGNRGNPDCHNGKENKSQDRCHGKGTGKPGEIKVSATLQRPGLCAKTGREQWVLITVEDNGPGIPADELKDIFRPFYTTKEEGTGLGLYITQQLVEKIKGRIDIRSEVGRGAAFAITFPCLRPDL